MTWRGCSTLSSPQEGNVTDYKVSRSPRRQMDEERETEFKEIDNRQTGRSKHIDTVKDNKQEK